MVECGLNIKSAGSKTFAELLVQVAAKDDILLETVKENGIC